MENYNIKLSLFADPIGAFENFVFRLYILPAKLGFHIWLEFLFSEMANYDIPSARKGNCPPSHTGNGI